MNQPATLRPFVTFRRSALWPRRTGRSTYLFEYDAHNWYALVSVHKVAEGGMTTGSCLCGAVSFEVVGDLPPPDACHCSQCRKHSGHFFASTDVPRAALTVHGAENVKWFRSSENVRRGFCSTCGCSLFWDPSHKDWIGIAMGAFDGPTNTKMKIHVHVADKGDYYDIVDGVPQNQH
jgi:hypothetical protein